MNRKTHTLATILILCILGHQKSYPQVRDRTTAAYGIVDTMVANHYTRLRELPHRALRVNSKDNVLGIFIDYNFPNLFSPLLILPSGDSIDGSQFVRFDAMNRHILEDAQRSPGAYRPYDGDNRHLRKHVGIELHRSYRNYLICLTASNRGRDILFWKMTDGAFNLISIHPCETYGDFIDPVTDTFAIGGISEDEGSLGGGQRYFAIISDTLRLIKDLNVQGNKPVHGESNPVDNATTIRYLLRFFDNSGKMVRDTVWFDCRDADGNIIYAHAAGDSISLYKDGNWGREYVNVRPDNRRFRIGLSAFLGGVSYIEVEYRGRWYLTPRSQIVIEQ